MTGDKLIKPVLIQSMFKVFKQTFHMSHVSISQEVKGALMWNL